jgi:hypothetical protein
MPSDIKDFLERMAGEVMPSPIPRSNMFRRATGRRLTTVTAFIIAVGLIAFGGVAGMRALTRPATVTRAQSAACSWQMVSSPNHDPSRFYNALTNVAVVSSDDVWAIGWYSQGGEGSSTVNVILHWDGTTWNEVSHPEPGGHVQLYDIAAISSNDVWAVGATSDANGNGPHGLIEHWDGNTWSVVPAADPDMAFWHFEGVAGTGPDDVWAVGNTATGHSGGTLVEHWDGTSWRLVPSPSPDPRPLVGDPYPGLDAVTAIGPDNAWAVGEATNVAPAGPSNTLIEHWDGTSWTLAHSPDAVSSKGEAFDHLLSVAASSPDDVWAVGSWGDSPGIGGGESRVLMEHWDGSSWQIVKAPNAGVPDGFAAVAAIGGSAWAVGASEPGGSQQALVEQWDGTTWSVVDTPAGPNTALTGIGGLASGGVWAVGSHGHETLTLRCN